MPAPPDADRALDTRCAEDPWTEEGTGDRARGRRTETDLPAFDAETTVRAPDTDGSIASRRRVSTPPTLCGDPGAEDGRRERARPASRLRRRRRRSRREALAACDRRRGRAGGAPAPDIDGAGDGHHASRRRRRAGGGASPEIDGAGDRRRQDRHRRLRSDGPNFRQRRHRRPTRRPDPALFAHALRIAEALIFASDRPVTPARLAGALPPGCDARAVLTALAAACAGRPVQLVEVGGGFAFRTAPDLAPAITRVVEVPRRLPRAAMETLAIVAYHQPVTRAEIEEIRGASLSQIHPGTRCWTPR